MILTFLRTSRNSFWCACLWNSITACKNVDQSIFSGFWRNFTYGAAWCYNWVTFPSVYSTIYHTGKPKPNDAESHPQLSRARTLTWTWSNKMESSEIQSHSCMVFSLCSRSLSCWKVNLRSSLSLRVLWTSTLLSPWVPADAAPTTHHLVSPMTRMTSATVLFGTCSATVYFLFSSLYLLSLRQFPPHPGLFLLMNIVSYETDACFSYSCPTSRIQHR